MKILSWNVNGLRSVYRKGLAGWLKTSGADIACLQETKIQRDQVTHDLASLNDHYSYFSYAFKKGSAGVAVYSKNKPLDVKTEIGLKRFDEEGRFLALRYPEFTLFNLYLPHGGRQKENLGYKLEAYEYLLNYLRQFPNKNLVLVGDFNIARREIDLARPKENKNNIMFTPKEREQIDKLVGLNFTDTFRKFHSEGNHYTWWPYFANARQRNLGWRIDYVFTSRLITSKLQNAFILSDIIGSDHCPVGIEIRL